MSNNEDPSTILITGANSGIGLAACRLFAQREATKRVVMGEFVPCWWMISSFVSHTL